MDQRKSESGVNTQNEHFEIKRCCTGNLIKRHYAKAYFSADFRSHSDHVCFDNRVFFL